MAAFLSLCTLHLINASRNSDPKSLGLRRADQYKASNPFRISKGSQLHQSKQVGKLFRRFRVFAVTEGSAKSSKSDEKIPSWARPESDEPPPWARDEAKDVSGQTFEIPFYGYLLASAITAIAAIGSIFEYINQRPVFGVLNSDSMFYAPLLGFFAFTGVPTSAFLWFKSVQAANKASEEQDRRDGYL
ncbi:hypothetical protein AAC387_Pa03g3546 [Persea americana]|eukprot:TRINITY_DN18858_c0_g1_i1.p1 TRINITY_DN18858_c0_g1~~TRINITY_DN18858_c0_g1_i1.p1  ORF type:complete len:188 (-),score=24.11 TRINITY_DN18858_c0_g1_i1:271-834(-)